MVGLRARFGAPLTGLNSPVVIILLLTVPRRRPFVFLRCMSMLFHIVLVTLLLVSLVVFSSTVSIFPFTPSFYFFDLPSPRSPSPVPFDFVDLLLNPLFVFFEFLISYKLFIFYWLTCPCYVLCPVLFLFWSSRAPCRWLLLLGRWGAVFIELPWWSCLSYFKDSL
jgi:hypothetical protein